VACNFGVSLALNSIMRAFLSAFVACVAVCVCHVQPAGAVSGWLDPHTLSSERLSNLAASGSGPVVSTQYGKAMGIAGDKFKVGVHIAIAASTCRRLCPRRAVGTHAYARSSLPCRCPTILTHTRACALTGMVGHSVRRDNRRREPIYATKAAHAVDRDLECHLVGPRLLSNPPQRRRAQGPQRGLSQRERVCAVLGE